MAFDIRERKKCPHCGKIYSNVHVFGFHAEDKLIGFGNPIRVCPICGKKFIDNDIFEAAIKKVPGAYYRKFNPTGVALLIFFAGLSINLIMRRWHEYTNPVAYLAVYIACAIIPITIGYVRAVKNEKRVRDEEIASDQRLKNNPDYAVELNELGLEVPDKYLPQEYLDKLKAEEEALREAEARGELLPDPKEKDKAAHKKDDSIYEESLWFGLKDDGYEMESDDRNVSF